ncbi:prepilin-type N-terminal cleavage/methylation domain-containing protein [Leptothrix discophora]|uniref:Prepilin-type N-terminal cleavage/methylation domain-containing protein n=1 Tax=Leptothrix discophora TaxID=89 RepID=A0ABT9G0Q9_LEPDI|nr:prepilin-type N-terminal cleavage/methylation domain-containing protein [Leptothrix discophora]MDP4300073.1 prepilin-type N-terminal cleavage/methylation domain-containing protein [Leptothrix discophora]
MRRTRSGPIIRKTAAGLTLIELVVALALGLLLVGAAATLLLARLDAQRRLLADVRLGLALDTVADLAARELRRAGHWGRADDARVPVDTVGAPEPPAMPPANPHAAMQPAAPAEIDGSPVTATTETRVPAWSYGRASTDHPDLREDMARDPDETGALRLNASTQALDLRQSGPSLLPGAGDNWQALTDPQRLRITHWQVSRSDRILDLRADCPPPRGTGGDTPGPPKLVIRRLTLDLVGHDPAAPDRPQRRSRTVRVRNDELRGQCPAP